MKLGTEVTVDLNLWLNKMAWFCPLQILNKTFPVEHLTKIDQKLEAHVTAQDLKKKYLKPYSNDSESF